MSAVPVVVKELIGVGTRRRTDGVASWTRCVERMCDVK